MADLAARHNTTNGAPAMPLAPDHGPYTDDLDDMTMDDLFRTRRLLDVQKRLTHLGPDTLEAAVCREIEYRDHLRARLTGGAA